MKRFEENVTGFLFLFIALFMFYQVLSRYLFHHSLSYSEEIVRYLFIWASMLGISAAFSRRAHIAINLLPQKISERFCKPFDIVMKMGAVLFLGVLVYHGTLSVILQWKTHQMSSALGWPIVWVTLSIPVGGILAILRVILSKSSTPAEEIIVL